MLAKLNPGIFCCLNTNLKDNVEVSDITKKGFQTFKQNVSGGMGGIVLYLNHFLNPSLVPDYISQDFENIWVSFEFPDLYEIDQRKEKISSVLGVLREPPTNAKSFYSNLADTTNRSKLNTLWKLQIFVVTIFQQNFREINSFNSKSCCKL